MKTIGLTGMLVLSVAFAAHAENPLFNYQGRLLGSDGQPVSESVTVAVNIYTSAAGGAVVYGEEVGSVVVQNGLYSFSYGTNPPAIRQALSGQEGWLELVVNSSVLSPRQRLHYTPYAVSLDEHSLVQSTQFLLDMIAKHELEIQALRAQAGMPNTSGGEQYFTETFPDADGQNNLVNTNLTDAFYVEGEKVYTWQGVLVEPATIGTSNCLVNAKKTIGPILYYVSHVESEIGYTGESNIVGLLYCGWHYVGGMRYTSAVPVACSNGVWTNTVTTNWYPTQTVQYLDIEIAKGTNNCEISGRIEEKNTRIHISSSVSTNGSWLVLNIPTITGRVSHAALYAGVVENTDPSLVQFDVTDGAVTVSNISLNQKCSMASLSNNPTRLNILLRPAQGESDPMPAIESVMFKWWHE